MAEPASRGEGRSEVSRTSDEVGDEVVGVCHQDDILSAKTEYVQGTPNWIDLHTTDQSAREGKGI